MDNDSPNRQQKTVSVMIFSENFQRTRLSDPIETTIAIIDHECPRCGHQPLDDLPFEIGIDGVGNVFGFYCHNCGMGLLVSERFLE